MPQALQPPPHRPTQQATWSAFLLAICFVLPAMTYKQCDQVHTLYPVQTGVMGFFYLPGIVVAIIALRKLGTSFGWLMTLRILLWLGSLALIVCAFYIFSDEGSAGAALFAVGTLLVAAMFLWAGGIRQRDEKYAARLGIALMVIDIPLFGLLSWPYSSVEHGLVGGYLALLAAAVFGHACIRWLKNPRLPDGEFPPPPFPTAIVVEP
jgi:hypothetical protein